MSLMPFRSYMKTFHAFAMISWLQFFAHFSILFFFINIFLVAIVGVDIILSQTLFMDCIYKEKKENMERQHFLFHV